MTHYISITPNLATLRAVIEITHDAYRVDIGSSTLRTILGWPGGSAIVAKSRHEAPNIVQITSVNEIHADGTYVKGAAESSAHQGYVLGSFYPDVPPGYKINYSPRHLNWLRATRPEISNIRVLISDQDGRPINLRGELLTISCLVREVADS